MSPRVPDDRPIGEVSVRELSRDTCEILRRIGAYERLIVSRHGQPVAVLLSIDDALVYLLDRLPAEQLDSLVAPLLRKPPGSPARSRQLLIYELLGSELSVALRARMGRKSARGSWRPRRAAGTD